MGQEQARRFCESNTRRCRAVRETGLNPTQKTLLLSCREWKLIGEWGDLGNEELHKM
jgi:hypothetical protein